MLGFWIGDGGEATTPAGAVASPGWWHPALPGRRALIRLTRRGTNGAHFHSQFHQQPKARASQAQHRPRAASPSAPAAESMSLSQLLHCRRRGRCREGIEKTGAAVAATASYDTNTPGRRRRRRRTRVRVRRRTEPTHADEETVAAPAHADETTRRGQWARFVVAKPTRPVPKPKHAGHAQV